jgi:hypothetical protein
MLKITRKTDKIIGVFESVCAKKSVVIFVTPFLRFESRFVGMSGIEIHVSTEGVPENALHSPHTIDVRMRFPWGASFLEAPVKVLGFGIFDGIKTLVLELPIELYEDDLRSGFRVRPKGSILVEINRPDTDRISAELVDVSVGGVKLAAKVGQFKGALKCGDKFVMNIPIPNVVTIVANGVVRYVNNSGFGVQFMPSLDSEMLDPLASWIFKKQEEERERLLFLGEEEGDPEWKVGM